MPLGRSDLNVLPSSRPRAHPSAGSSVEKEAHTAMKRFALLLAAAVAAIAVALPATAGAATFHGVVIAKDSARKALVTASRNGTVRTVRVRAGFKRVSVGRLVAVRAAQLPDSTFSASAVRRLGKARHVHVHGTVVSKLGARLVLSAGGSIFALRVRGKAGASEDAGLQPGDEVDCDARVKHGGLEARQGDIDEVGHADQLVLEGIYLDTTEDGVIELAVVHRGRVLVSVPEGWTSRRSRPGDEIALVVSIGEGGAFTLVKAENEDDNDNDDGDGGMSKGEFAVVGTLAAVTDEAVAVKVEHRPKPVRCGVPDGFDLSGFEVGQRVYMSCKYGDGHFVLLQLKKKVDPPPADYFSVEGTISELAPDHVGVAVDGQEEPVTCAVPEGIDLLGFAVGDGVKMYCWKKDGGPVLKALVSANASIGPGGMSWFVLEGQLLEVDGDHVSIDADGHPDPVSCAVAPGADLSGFNVGDQVTMKCTYVEGAFRLKLLKSDSAQYELV